MSAKNLFVYRNGELLGKLFDSKALTFIYDDKAFSNQLRPISPNLPISVQTHSGEMVESFFENLLPEAGIREYLKLKFQVTSTFGLLSNVGGDTASDLTILKDGILPDKYQYEPLTWKDVHEEFSKQQGKIREIQEVDGLRISLAGAQRKLSVFIDDKGNLYLPRGGSPSSHIVKPDIKGIDGVWSSAMNEAFVMTLASRSIEQVSEVYYQPVAKACVIKRYDRLISDGFNTQRIHQLDMCQLDGKSSTIKYESEGGPSFLRCYDMIKERGTGAMDLKRLLQWLFFNLAIGNNDSHGKNLSIYFPDGKGAKLAPFYDLISTNLYSGLSKNFAFNVGGETQPHKIGHAQIEAVSASLNIKKRYSLDIANVVIESILASLDDVSNEMYKVASPDSEKTLIERLNKHIRSNTSKFKNRL